VIDVGSDVNKDLSHKNQDQYFSSRQGFFQALFWWRELPQTSELPKTFWHHQKFSDCSDQTCCSHSSVRL